jgi:hypothetical protein
VSKAGERSREGEVAKTTIGLYKTECVRDGSPFRAGPLATQLDPVHAKHRCTAHIDLAAAYASDGKPAEAACQAISALDIITVTRSADSLRRVAGLYEMIRPSGIPESRELGSRLLEVRATS